MSDQLGNTNFVQRMRHRRLSQANYSNRQADPLWFSQAFTLIGLLVVIGVIAIITSLLLPALSSARQRAFAAQCINNKSQVMRAWTLYADEFNNYMVPNSPVGFVGAKA